MQRSSNRRDHLGPKASAALPAVDKALQRLGWNHARLAVEVGLSTAAISQLMWGDTQPGRRFYNFCTFTLRVKTHLWDKACPPNWRPRANDVARARARRELAATG